MGGVPARRRWVSKEGYIDFSRKRPRFLVSAEVAALFRTEQRTVHRWVTDGCVQSLLTPGGHRIYPLEQFSDVLEYLSK